MFKKWNSLGLGTRIIVIMVLLMLAVVGVNYVVIIKRYRAAAENAMVEKAAAFTAVAEETKNHTASIARSGSFDHEGLIKDLNETIASGKKYSDAKIYQTLPVVVGWTAAQKAAEKEKIEFHISSFEARNKSNEPAKGSFDETLLRDLTTQVESNGAEIISRVNAATGELHYMRAIKLTEDCMMCHGSPGNKWDTARSGKDILGFAMEGWKPGYMHGAYHVVMPLAPVQARVESFLLSGLIWSVPMILVAVVIFALLLRSIFNRPVAVLIERIKDIAQGEGDLTKRIEITSHDEIGELGTWFNAFVQKVHDIISEVSQATHDVASSSTEIAASSEQIASGLNQQSQQVMQISAAIEEMSASIVEVAKKSVDAAHKAGDAGKTAGEGSLVVSQTIEGMNLIREAVNAGSVSVTELGKRSEQIGAIINVINDIADQTNLLALNAAIEAARAGEHGRGFAVVADEVRKLADRTTKATEEIAQSIKAIQVETHQAVAKMNGGTEQVQSGVKRATEAGVSLEQIVASSREVALMIQSIAAAAEQQSAASEQVSKNVDSITAVSKQSTEGASQAASAATQLSAKAEQLQLMVRKFKIQERSTNANTFGRGDGTGRKYAA